MTDRRRSGRPIRSSTDPPKQSSPNGRDERPASSAACANPPSIPTPAWVPTDDIIGAHADRQVLVIGDSPTGTALTLLLDAAGYDPLLVGDADAQARSRLTYVSPAALEVLGSLDLGVLLHDCGSAVDGVTVQRVDCSGSSAPVDVASSRRSDAGRAPPVVVPTPVLVRTLRDAASAAATVQDRTVDSISRRGEGVTVVFDNGVEESFDVVVDVRARGSLRPDGRPGLESVRQYETVVDDTPDRHRFRDVWSHNAVVQWVPGVADAETLVRITVPSDGDDGRDGRWVPPSVPGVPESGAFERRRVPQRRLPEGAVPDGWWGDGRLAYCGPAACPAAPAAGGGQSLGITDALGLVSALTRNTDARSAVATYAAARAGRFDALRRAASRGEYPTSTPGTVGPPLGSLRTLRAIALEPFFGTAPGPLGGGLPG